MSTCNDGKSSAHQLYVLNDSDRAQMPLKVTIIGPETSNIIGGRSAPEELT